MTSHAPYRQPARLTGSDGEVRKVGFELEFSGVTLDDTANALKQKLDGNIVYQTEAELVLELPSIGKLTVELDWAFLKRKAAESAEKGEPEEWLKPLSQAAGLLVPVEVVCPPVAIDKLERLDELVDILRDLGAQGTEESLIAAYGVHINAEIPQLNAPCMHAYLKAFSLLQWWLVEAHEVNTARKISPYIGLYPEAYVVELLEMSEPDMDQLFATYLEHNPTRNRALDMLPLLAEIDESRVQDAVGDAKVNARPTFHYRLPNCQIERPGWSPADSWNVWCVVEALANDPQALEELGQAFLDARLPVIGVNRRSWVEFITRWLQDRELA
ncbi:amidoligase family protein [Marinobacterium lutimaris]|uniref:Putative amidoligase enzyme n=1 Tax=Marinobacterium lutimaris TaxID=568106 RepID=A0A1H5Z0E9_9GAMM|nr:amidoligase family protein [Marinobacterium lutimaris]SEG29510.1 Putative amidoligase enzyme [Marinobacterium lutimaris]